MCLRDMLLTPGNTVNQLTVVLMGIFSGQKDSCNGLIGEQDGTFTSRSSRADYLFSVYTL